MGIKDLLTVIKSECPDAIKVVSMKEYYGETLAVDMSIFIYKDLLAAGDNSEKEEACLIPEGGPWLDCLAHFLCKLKMFSIKAVCIFDGTEQPDLKTATQADRVNTKKRALEKLNRCQQIYEGLVTGKVNLTPKIQEECKKLIILRGRYTDFADVDSVKESLIVKIDKLKKSTLGVTQKHLKVAKRLIRAFGFPAIEAVGEAESACAQLAITGEAAGVLTEDTDVLAYGANMVSFGTNLKIHQEKFRVINHQNLVDSMGMNDTIFKDFCILLKCDYNMRKFDENKNSVPVKILCRPEGKGKKPSPVGRVKALKLIKEYENLDDMEDIIENFEDLKHNECRSLLSVTSEKIIEIGACKDLNIREIEKLEEYGLTRQDHIQKIWKLVLIK
ncbi:hypothetical protein OAG24_00505 [bacterium]|nr:hypothetical protein [bacterium]